MNLVKKIVYRIKYLVIKVVKNYDCLTWKDEDILIILNNMIVKTWKKNKYEL